MTQWRGLCGGLLSIVALVGSLACSPADTSLSLRAAESAEARGISSTDEGSAPLVESSSFGPDDATGLGSFPAFLPPVAVGTDTQECKLGTDPYSTCI
jgi:hypothetical protein